MGNKDNKKIFWQAHRGGGAYEAPDNTLAAFKYSWGLGGIPEGDVRSTKDGVIVCLHDDTPARTTTVPNSLKDRHISSFSYEEIRKWDAGIKFHERFKGEKIPSLEEVFVEMEGQPDRSAYLDLKEVDLIRLGELIDKYKVNNQIIFTHNLQENCIKMRSIAPGVKTMLWIGGNADSIKEKFNKALQSKLKGLDQVQIHLNPIKGQILADWPYDIDEEFLEYALEQSRRLNVDLEVLPFRFEEDNIDALISLGIHWYATDEPARFVHCVNKALK